MSARPRLLACLLAAFFIQGCGALDDDPLTQFNSWSRIEFDCHTVGLGWDLSGQAISCKRESDDGPLASLTDAERWPRDHLEWLVAGDVEIGMRLDLPRPGRAMSVELAIGDAIYRSDARTKTKLQPRPGDRGVYRDSLGKRQRIEGPVGGRAVFRAIPLASGEPFEGKEQIGRLVIEWDCLGRPTKPAKLYAR